MENSNLELAIGEVPFLYGYVGGEKNFVANNVEQICAFILGNRLKDTQIINIFDQLEISSTVGGFIMSCENQWFLQNKLLPVLVPMQTGEVEVPEFVPYTDEKYIINNVRLEDEDGKGYYLVDLDFFDGYPEQKRTSEFFETEEELIAKYPDSINTDQSYDIAMEREII